LGRFISLAILLVGIGCSCISGNGGMGADDDGDGDGPGGDAGALTVISTNPENEEPRAQPDAPIVVAFSHPVLTESVSPATFAVTSSSGPVAGAFDVDGATVTFTPSAPMHRLGVHDVMLTTGIASDDAGSLAAPFQLSFRVSDGEWSGRIDVADGVGDLREVAHNRRGDMVLAYATSVGPVSIEAVLFDAAQSAFSTPGLVEQEAQPFGEAHAAINDEGDAIVVWSGLTDPQTRGWSRRSAGSWVAAIVAPGQVGRVALTSDGTAIMASDVGGDAVIETLAPSATAWSSPAIAIPSASVRALLQAGDRVELIAYKEATQQLMARGYAQGSMTAAQALSSPGAAVSSIDFQYLPGEDMVMTWLQGDDEVRYARFDGAAGTWTQDTLAAGTAGSAVCENTAGARLAAFISGESLLAAHAEPGESFAGPQNVGSRPGMETAGCAIDELGHGHLFWAGEGGRSFRSRFADGLFAELLELANGPPMVRAVSDPIRGTARVIFFPDGNLTARSFD